MTELCLIAQCLHVLVFMKWKLRKGYSTELSVAYKNKFLQISEFTIISKNCGYLIPHQFSSVTQSCQTLCNPMDCSMPGLQFITSSRSLLKLISIESVMPSHNLILCCPLLLPPSIFPSKGVFSNESALRIRWPKYWCFSFNINPSNEYSGLISFRMDWSDFSFFAI